jgi:hypothetical protein
MTMTYPFPVLEDTHMDIWNREELYTEIWQQPMVRIAAKYGISSVMLGKVCRKLQIPVPGRGYWVKKEFGKPVKHIPLPEAKGDLPIMRRFKKVSLEKETPQDQQMPAPEPTDPEYRRILEVEARTVAVVPETKRHNLVTTTSKALMRAKADERQLLHRPWDQSCLDLRVSKDSLDRALNIMNAVILTLEAERFVVTAEPGKQGTTAQVFGHQVPFSIVEKVREKGRRQVTEYSYTRTVIDYQPSGDLEFRAGGDSYSCSKYRDGKKQRLEGLISKLAGAIVREGRSCVIRAEQARLDEIERQKKAQERWVLSQQIDEEEKKVRELDSWVTNWGRAEQMRQFIAVLEKLWRSEGHDLSVDSPKGQRIVWMKQQADRLDPMVASPPSILDRKDDLNRWY